MGGENDVIQLLRKLFPQAFDAGGTAQAHTQRVIYDVSNVACAVFVQPKQNFQAAAAAGAVYVPPTWGSYLQRVGDQLERTLLQLEHVECFEWYLDHLMPELKDNEHDERKEEMRKNAERLAPQQSRTVWPARTDDASFAAADWFPYDGRAVSLDDVRYDPNARLKFNEMLTLFALNAVYEYEPGRWRPFLRRNTCMRIVGAVLAGRTHAAGAIEVRRAQDDTLHVRTSTAERLPLRYCEADVGMIYRLTLAPTQHTMLVANDVDVFVALLYYRRAQVAAAQPGAAWPTLLWRRPVSNAWDSVLGVKRSDVEYIDMGVLYEWTTGSLSAAIASALSDAQRAHVNAIDVLTLIVALRGTDYTESGLLCNCTALTLWRAYLEHPLVVVESVTLPGAGLHKACSVSIDHANLVAWVRNAYIRKGLGFLKRSMPTELTLARLARQCVWYMHYFVNGWRPNAYVPTGFERSPCGRYALYGWKRDATTSKMLPDDSVQVQERYQVEMPAA